ncbi:MAG: homoserine dehydrogenase [Lachnospiraceae bacterium]|nr:homoserine dehydrogenase [Lachnospiraceae bacterium]
MDKKETIQLAVLGAGTVGTGVYKVVQNLKEDMPHKIGGNLVISKILVRDASKEREGIDASLLTDNWKEIIDNKEIDIIVEVMGGIEPAKTYISESLKAGKNVVTANKDLMAEYGKELLDLAEENGCDLMFEASVAGGIPILHPLKHCLSGNHLTEVTGIINGTTNFILSKMTDEGVGFEETLKLAQDLGYAEADPTADVEGLDAARKVAIMASIAFNSRVTFEDVYTEGITEITARDIEYAKDMDCVIKLLGVAKNTEEGIEVRVHPMLIDRHHPLASVNDSFNAVFVRGDAVDDAMFYGRGAGELPTASAVVGDVIEVARNIQNHCTGQIACTCYKTIPIKPMSEIESRYFVRLRVEDRAGTLASIASVFGNNHVSIEKIVQKNKRDDFAEIVVITDEVKEKDITNSLTILKTMPLVGKISNVIRVY